MFIQMIQKKRSQDCISEHHSCISLYQYAEDYGSKPDQHMVFDLESFQYREQGSSTALKLMTTHTTFQSISKYIEQFAHTHTFATKKTMEAQYGTYINKH